MAVRLSALSIGRALLPRSMSKPQSLVRLGLEPATFLLVAECLNHYATERHKCIQISLSCVRTLGEMNAGRYDDQSEHDL
jgi:hypothetical protein